ncbi:DUF1934 domain-containing protein [Streptococcus infantis]|uniref:DUF1934 domain-containing protein n=1 Tax=Streptococcus infantis TaxID=68892 RepID=UPI0039C06C0E
MKIRMRNKIQFDEQLEVIDQLYDVELREKGDFSYLLFYNEEQEKVVIKFQEEELVMTRFSNPKTIMRFLKEAESLAYIPTPMGMQEFIIQTNHYEVGEEKIELAYQLQNKEGVPFANYRLEITWG